MSREIKFRAWDKGLSNDDNIPMMTQALTIQEWIDQRGFYYVNGCQADLSDFDWKNELIFMQYTGLKDKNGVEIYECDLLKVKYNSECEDIVEVYCSYDGFKVKGTSCENKDLGYSTYLGNVIHEAEAVGNIYENPELLKRKVNE